MSLRLPSSLTSDERHTQWIRVAERIFEEQVTQGWRHRMFRLFRAVFSANPQLPEDGGFVLKWAADNYVDAALMSLRRELDVQAGTENLRNLLLDISLHPEVLTRARYMARWQRGEVDMANRAFDSFNPTRVAGRPDSDFINPAQVRDDLDALVAEAERLRLYAERTRAHRTPERGIERSVTFRDLHAAIRHTRGVVGKYYALLTLRSVAQWEPEPQYDTIAPFMKPWVTDGAAVARLVDEGAEDR
jgi:hypothetical protein